MYTYLCDVYVHMCTYIYACVYMDTYLFVNVWVAPWPTNLFKSKQDSPETIAMWLEPCDYFLPCWIWKLTYKEKSMYLDSINQ